MKRRIMLKKVSKIGTPSANTGKANVVKVGDVVAHITVDG